MADLLTAGPPTKTAIERGLLDARVVAAGAPLTAQDTLTYQRQAQDGDPRRWWAFQSELYARDAHLFSEVEKAAEYVAACPLNIRVPEAILTLYGRDSAEATQAEEIARVVKAEFMAAGPQMAEATAHLVVSGFGHGLGPLNLVVEPGAGFEGKERIVELVPLPAQRFCWATVAGKKGPEAVNWMIQLTDDPAKLTPVDGMGAGLLLFEPEAHVPNLARRGFFRRCVVPALIRIYGVTWWSRGVETAGMPIRFGYYPDGDDKAKAAVVKVLKDIGTDAFAALPQGARVEIVGNVMAGATPHEAIVEWAAREESKAALGATQTTDVQVGAGSKASAEIHDIVILRRTAARARKIAAFYRKYLVQPYVARNWGEDQAKRLCPDVEIRVSGGIDRQAIALTILTARQAGIDLAKHDAYEMLEWPMPGKDDELLGEGEGQDMGYGEEGPTPPEEGQTPEEAAALLLSAAPEPRADRLEAWGIDRVRAPQRAIVNPYRRLVALAKARDMDPSELAAMLLHEFGSGRAKQDKLAGATQAILAHAALMGAQNVRKGRK